MKRLWQSPLYYPFACIFPLVLLLLCLSKQAHAQDSSGFVSDDFSSSQLDTSIWNFIDPLGDSAARVDGTRLLLTVPAGVSHDVWTSGNNSSRVMQWINNTDFELEVKFETSVNMQFQLQGVIVEQDSANYLRFDFYSDGVNTRIFSAGFTNNAVTSEGFIVNTGSPMYLRVKREGDDWTLSYSVDGAVWNVARQFTHSLIANSAGVYAGNAGGANAPEHTAAIDYIFNTSDPITPEDGEIIADTTPPFIKEIKKLAGSNQFEVLWETDEMASGYLEYGLTTNYELGFIDQNDLSTSHSLVVTGLTSSTSYNFRLRSADASGNESVSENLQITVADNPYFDLWYGSSQNFGHLSSNAQRWVNILGHVSGPSTISSMYYSLNGGNPMPLSLGADGRRLQNTNDFNVDIEYLELFDGVNTLALTATDDSGIQKTENISINYQSGNSLPLPYYADWSSATKIEDVAQVVDGSWSLVTDGIRTGGYGYDRIINLGDITWDNYEATVPFTLHSINPDCSIDIASNPCNDGALLGVLIRWQGHHPTSSQPAREWIPLGALGSYRWRRSLNAVRPALYLTGGDGATIVSDPSVALPAGRPHIFKIRAETSGTQHQYKFKLWPQDQPEPSNWSLEGVQELTNSFGNGSLALVAHHVDATFGNISVRPLDGSTDTTPPVISNVLVSAITNDSATITWTTNEAASSLVEYGLDNGYGLSASDSTLLTSHSITLNGLTAGTLHHFRINSTDGSSNTASGTDLTFTTTGTAGGDTTPPVISNVSVSEIFNESATITWSTNEAADSLVEYGLDSTYGLSASDSTLLTSHSITLNGLTAGTLHHFRVSSTDGSSNAASGADLTFTTSGGADTSPSGLVPDAFDAGGLDTSIWTWVDPLGDSTLEFNGSQAAITVPAGTSHDIWTDQTHHAPRIRQAANNTDFELEVKFNSAVSTPYQIQGITVEQDIDNLLRFDFHFDGTYTRVYSASFVNGTGTKRIRSSIAGSVPLFLRVTRVGDQWTESYSYDGADWFVAGTFNHNLTVTGVGLFSGNAGSAPPQHTALIDYFTVDGLQPGTGEGDTTAPVISNVSAISGSVAFSKKTIDTTVEEAHYVVGADLDGDFDIDLVATSFARDQVYLYINNGSGDFDKRILDDPIYGAYPVHLGDVDLDGDIDILVGAYDGRQILWYINDGLGNFAKELVDGTTQGPHSVVTGDMDGDGDVDLLATYQGAGTIAWYENDGNSQFTPLVIDSAATEAKRAAFGDLDGDGDNDVAAASFALNEIAWYQNDGAQNFSKIVVDSGATGAYFVVVEDIDSDGFLDLVSASKLDNTVAWYRNDGSGNFSKAIIDNQAMAVRSVFTADIDADGDMDVFSASPDDNTIAWHINDGNGIFSKIIVDDQAGGAYGVAALDVDLDGNMDLIGANVADHNVNIYYQVTGTTATVTWTTNEAASSLVEYGLSSTYDQTASNPVLTTSHRVILTGLSPNTLYHFRVSSTDGSSNAASGTNLTFTTTDTSGGDTDADGVPDLEDNCTEVANANQRDTNGDGFGNMCDADLDNSQTVDLADFSLFRAAFGGSNADADFNGDGAVDLADFSLFRAMFGNPPGPSAP